MGILNVTPDSFSDGGKYTDTWMEHAERMVSEGADVLDIGGYSTRPGAVEVPQEEEKVRVIPVIRALREQFPELTLSIDTFRAEVAREALLAGANWVNDVSGGRWDKGMFPFILQQNCPYILMHTQGTPAIMQQNPQYENVSREILQWFELTVQYLHQQGVKDLILDPGFGFGKTRDQNYRILHDSEIFQFLGLPLMAGVSRKRMICGLLDVPPQDALNGTTALHMMALEKGYRILRVHDVKEARQAIRVWEAAHLKKP